MMHIFMVGSECVTHFYSITDESDAQNFFCMNLKQEKKQKNWQFDTLTRFMD